MPTRKSHGAKAAAIIALLALFAVILEATKDARPNRAMDLGTAIERQLQE